MSADRGVDDGLVPSRPLRSPCPIVPLSVRTYGGLPPPVEGCPSLAREDIVMQGSSIYLIVAYAIVWLGLFVYLAVVAMRMRAVRTELAAVEELVREYQEHKDNN